jgi:sugar O-acyltransferase (sialic acid O-acetyltransferase NeuD family)
MVMADTIIIIGGSGHAKVVISTASELGINIRGIYDDDPGKKGTNLGKARILGPILNIDAADGEKAIIAIGDNRTRSEIDKRLVAFHWFTAIHPRAYIHPSVSIGEGTVVFAGAVIQPDTVIGRHCIINTNAAIDHDCVIGDYSHIGPGVCLAGNVTVGEGAFLGIGAVAVMGISIGRWSIIGAGGVVIEDMPDNVTAVGSPARIIKRF